MTEKTLGTVSVLADRSWSSPFINIQQRHVFHFFFSEPLIIFLQEETAPALQSWNLRNREPNVGRLWGGQYRSCNLGSQAADLGSVPALTHPTHFLTVPSGVFDKVTGPRINVVGLHLIKLTEVTPAGSCKCSESQLCCSPRAQCAPASPAHNVLVLFET